MDILTSAIGWGFIGFIVGATIGGFLGLGLEALGVPGGVIAWVVMAILAVCTIYGVITGIRDPD